MIAALIFATFSVVVAENVSQSGSEDASFLQKIEIPHRGEIVDVHEKRRDPFVIGLRRESVPVYRRGKIASFKTSYSGVLSVGTPAQEFRVVFDTGSGNIVLPAAECSSEACLVADRRKYSMRASSTATAINQDGSIVPDGAECDQVTIGFGTGEITGEFATDQVCFGAPAGGESVGLDLGNDSKVSNESSELCVEMSIVLAVEMSTQPFKTFRFDGILGLGLDGLAMSNHFSAFEMLMGTGLPESHFGVFLTEGEDGEESEIAFGGMDSRRVLEPLSWAPVAMPELGYWQVQILAVRINGETLDVCKDGTCRGVVDTGTSHLGVPAPFDAEVAKLLTTDAGDLLDCRLADAPEMEIELAGFNLTLHPFNYMRRLPLRAGVSVSSAQGVYVPSNETNATFNAPSSADPVAKNASENALQPSATTVAGEAPSTAPAPADQGKVSESAPGVQAISGGETVDVEAEDQVKRFCRPRLMPVRLPAPLGPKLFILGEPVLHRYYTVYDWANHRVGFSLANNRRNMMDPNEHTDRRGTLPKEVDMLLMQERMTLRERQPGRKVRAKAESDQEETMFVQVEVKLTFRRRRLEV